MRMFMESFATAALGKNMPPVYLIVVYMIPADAPPEQQQEFLDIKDILVQYGQSHELEYKWVVAQETSFMF